MLILAVQAFFNNFRETKTYFRLRSPFFCVVALYHQVTDAWHFEKTWWSHLEGSKCPWTLLSATGWHASTAQVCSTTDNYNQPTFLLTNADTSSCCRTTTKVVNAASGKFSVITCTFSPAHVRSFSYEQNSYSNVYSIINGHGSLIFLLLSELKNIWWCGSNWAAANDYKNWQELRMKWVHLQAF